MAPSLLAGVSMRKKRELEKHIEKRFLKELKKRWPTAKARKMNGYGNRSWPDRMILLPNVSAFFIEFKRPGGVLSLGQEQEIKELRELGNDVYVSSDADQAINICTNRMIYARKKI